MEHNIDTTLVHGGRPQPYVEGAVTTPIFQATVFELKDLAAYPGLRYIRYANLPDLESLARRLALLEGGEEALLSGSGMGAISGTLLALLKQGDHVVASRGLYGGTRAVMTNELKRFGIKTDFVSLQDARILDQVVRPETRVIYTETIGNPLMNVPDLEGIAAFGRAHGILTVIDNTFATPLGYQPLAQGFDLCLHSATKYLNGHSDVLAGVVVGKQALVKRVQETHRRLGPALDPHAAFLLTRGLKTLGLRVRRQMKSAAALATFLEEQPEVTGVRYPGLTSHPDHDRAKKILAGFGGMLAFELEGGQASAARFLQALKLVTHAVSLGGLETLAVLPALSSHAMLTPEQRQKISITDGLVRLSVGIEDPRDLQQDLRQAMDAI